MSTENPLSSLREIEGFLGAALFDPAGQALETISTSNLNLKAIGALANNSLLNAQKAAIEMGSGKARMVHVESEKGQFLALCHNEGSNPIRTEPGKTHVHLIVALQPQANLGLAKIAAARTLEAAATAAQPA